VRALSRWDVYASQSLTVLMFDSEKFYNKHNNIIILMACCLTLIVNCLHVVNTVLCKIFLKIFRRSKTASSRYFLKTLLHLPANLSFVHDFT